MNIVWRIAFRNLRQHRAKTLIVGLLIALGVVVLVVGNSLMDSAARGIERTYIRSYTGHLVISGNHSAAMTLFGIEDLNEPDAMPPTIPAFQAIVDHVAADPRVAAWNPQTTASAVIDFGDGRAYLQAFGIDAARYFTMFPDNLEILSGRPLAPGEEGILLAESTAEALARSGGVAVQSGDLVLLTASNQLTGLRVREVPVRGIFRFRQSNPQLETVSLLDATNLRAMTGMNLALVAQGAPGAETADPFGAADETALFGGGAPDLAFVEPDPANPVDEAAFTQIFGGRADWALTETDSPTWHFLLLRLHDGADAAAVQRDLQNYLDSQGIAATVSGWLPLAGPLAVLSLGMKGIFNIVVLVIAVVAVIIIMNTLVISVTERTTEIGTMRALGAQRGFVRRMIAAETMLTSVLFGLLGIGLGCLILLALNLVGITASNVFVEVLFGGKVLHPTPSVSAIVTSMIVVLLIGLVASLYPARVALKTEPVRAMQAH